MIVTKRDILNYKKRTTKPKKTKKKLTPQQQQLQNWNKKQANPSARDRIRKAWNKASKLGKKIKASKAKPKGLAAYKKRTTK